MRVCKMRDECECECHGFGAVGCATCMEGDDDGEV